MKKQKNINDLLREGYQEMYETAKQMTDDFEKLDNESLKYID